MRNARNCECIQDFDAAAQEDESLRRILDAIGESGEMAPYLEGEGTMEPSAFDPNDNETPRPKSNRRHNLPQSVDQANESIRKAANHISLALHEDNKFLFMGDLENAEINHVIDHLSKRYRLWFFVTITPHHGTHWHNALRSIRTYNAISSVGSRLFRHVSPKYKRISNNCIVTHLNGDALVTGWCYGCGRPVSWGRP